VGSLDPPFLITTIGGAQGFTAAELASVALGRLASPAVFVVDPALDALAGLPVPGWFGALLEFEQSGAATLLGRWCGLEEGLAGFGELCVWPEGEAAAGAGAGAWAGDADALV
jgi:hypothetical protein